MVVAIGEQGSNMLSVPIIVLTAKLMITYRMVRFIMNKLHFTGTAGHWFSSCKLDIDES